MSAGLEMDKDLTLHVVIVLRIRMLRELRSGQQPKWSSTAMNRMPQCSLLEPSRNIMSKLLDNYAMSLSCVCPPEHNARESSPGSRRMLAKLGELHQSLRLCQARNPSATCGSTYLDRPCEQGPNVVLGATMLHQERLEETLVQFGIL
jgi:hypothetical protein